MSESFLVQSAVSGPEVSWALDPRVQTIIICVLVVSFVHFCLRSLLHLQTKCCRKNAMLHGRLGFLVLCSTLHVQIMPPVIPKIG